MARAQLSISKTALLNNFKLIARKVPDLSLIPMIKANAYGHGAVYAAQSILGSPEARKCLYGFGVATFQEAIEIRLAIKNQNVPIIVFSDCAPWTAEHLALCRQYRLEPVFSEILSLLEFQRQRGSHELAVHIEVNTGMNRMGIPIDSLSLVKVVPKSVFTHLADADSPRSKLTQKQIAVFAQVIKHVRTKYPRSLFHFANSSAIWNTKQFSTMNSLMKGMSLARPGLSLYGIRPFEKAREDGLKRVMTVRAPILNRIFIEAGESVGYGGTYTCKKKSGEWVAVIGAGYADGVFRSLSSQGIAVYGKKKLKFIGRVSMDLSAVQGLAGMQVGDEVILWGNEIDPYEQAKLASTIPYELTTRIGERVSRSYE
jgi:alanine racemase